MRRKSHTEIEIPRIGINVQKFLSFFFDSILISSVLVDYQINRK